MCIQVSSDELENFGQEHDPNNVDDEKERDHGNERQKRRKRGRREKMSFKLKETQRNRLLCNTGIPMTVKVAKYSQQHEECRCFLLGGSRLSGFCVQYVSPQSAPSSYSMEIISIVLPSSTEEMQISPIKNMRFGMGEMDKLLFHAIMDNGETIMFIRRDDATESITNVYASHSRVLRDGEEPLKTIQRPVQLVAYCEKQKMFAVLSDTALVFYIYQGGRLATAKKRYDLRECQLGNRRFKAMVMEEINKEIWIWIIDERNNVYAFDYEAGWDDSKELNLGQDFESYQMMPMGFFLVALKPQYHNQQTETLKIHRRPRDQPLDDGVSDGKKSPGIKTATGRIELHAFYLMENKKLEYVVHKSSMTGYETGNEAEYKEGDGKEDFQVVDHVLLPAAFSTIDDYVSCSSILLLDSNKKGDLLLCAISKNMDLLYHPMTVEVTATKMTIEEDSKKEVNRKITKLDYMEYMIEKFG